MHGLDEFVDDVRWSFEQLRAATVSDFLERRTAKETPSGEAAAVAGVDAHELRLVDLEAADEVEGVIEADASLEKSQAGV